MASLRLSKGPIQINRGIDGETHESILVVSVASAPKIHLGGGHTIPVPIPEGDCRFTERDLSEDGKAALKALVAEVEAKVLEKAKARTADFASQTGIKID